MIEKYIHEVIYNFIYSLPIYALLAFLAKSYIKNRFDRDLIQLRSELESAQRIEQNNFTAELETIKKQHTAELSDRQNRFTLELEKVKEENALLRIKSSSLNERKHVIIGKFYSKLVEFNIELKSFTALFKSMGNLSDSDFEEKERGYFAQTDPTSSRYIDPSFSSAVFGLNIAV